MFGPSILSLHQLRLHVVRFYSRAALGYVTALTTARGPRHRREASSASHRDSRQQCNHWHRQAVINEAQIHWNRNYTCKKYVSSW
jgi:hypothetical protein